MKHLSRLTLLAALSIPASALAVEFNGSGFITLAAGKIVSAEYPDAYFASDYGQGGIYDNGKGWRIGPDSKLGLQGSVVFNPQWSATVQVISRGARGGNVNLEWLYGSYQATDNLTIQFGQKRLPLFYYSESQDVGYTLPWIRVPTTIYGWDVVNFRGANLIYRDHWGGWSATTELAVGTESRKDNPYAKIYNAPGDITDERWTDIVSADLTLSKDWLEARFSYLHSIWKTNDRESGTWTGWSDNGGQSYYSVGIVADPGNWVVRSEYSMVDRPTGEEKDWAFMVGVGYRMGKWLPMLTSGIYHGKYLNGDPNERWSVTTLSLRYDLTSSSALKVQYDVFHDMSEPGVTGYNSQARYGDSRLLTIAYDRVF